MNGNPNIQVEITDAFELHCFRLVLNPQSEMSAFCELHGRMRGDCGCQPRIEVMLDARSLVDLIHKCSEALCEWQAQTTGYLLGLVQPTPAEPPDGGAASKQKREASDV